MNSESGTGDFRDRGKVNFLLIHTLFGKLNNWLRNNEITGFKESQTPTKATIIIAMRIDNEF